ncbi:hypothetical protein [Actinomadura madurae]|uniref:hypothetical protein n=1 Tax=Actinomadura madurae TaxID=1993 RepID=UPI0020D24AEE|nr:hypothetical protein [Actinomadura madurae]MCQ0013417.1 hypothetical protein [Actinomadura madurae]
MLTEPSPGERLAASLRRSPIHVDPSLASALPAAERRRLLSKLRKAPTRVFVVLVPMVKGGTWTDADQLATVVHDRLGRDGIFITFDDDTENLTAREWGGDHSARDATGAVTIDRAMDDAPLAAKLGRALDLIISGTAAREYDRLSDELDKRVNARRSTRPEAAEEEDDGSLVPLGAGVAGLAVLGVGGFLLWRRRRMPSVRREAEGLLMPRTVFATANRATEDQLREQASREVIAFGELLDETTVPTTDERTRTLMATALDAYQAAGKTLDAAEGVPDLAASSSCSTRAGTRSPPPSPWRTASRRSRRSPCASSTHSTATPRTSSTGAPSAPASASASRPAARAPAPPAPSRPRTSSPTAATAARSPTTRPTPPRASGPRPATASSAKT